MKLWVEEVYTTILDLVPHLLVTSNLSTISSVVLWRIEITHVILARSLAVLFLVTATNYHNPMYKSKTFLCLTMLEVEVWTGSHWPKIKVPAGLYFFWRLREGSHSPAFSSYWAVFIPWFVAPPSILRAREYVLFQLLSMILTFSLSFT